MLDGQLLRHPRKRFAPSHHGISYVFTHKETTKVTKIYFRFFNEQFFMCGKELSIALGFHKRFLFDLNALVKDHPTVFGGVLFLMKLLVVKIA